MEISWKKIIVRFCIIVIIIFFASYVVGEYREYKEQQEIGTQLEREEVSTEVRNEVLTGKAGVKDKLLVCIKQMEILLLHHICHFRLEIFVVIRFKNIGTPVIPKFGSSQF